MANNILQITFSRKQKSTGLHRGENEWQPFPSPNVASDARNKSDAIKAETQSSPPTRSDQSPQQQSATAKIFEILFRFLKQWHEQMLHCYRATHAW